MTTKTQPQNPVDLFSLLTVLFVGLKLTGHITWSWWWVLSPTLIPAAIALTMIVVGVLGLAIMNSLRPK